MNVPNLWSYIFFLYCFSNLQGIYPQLDSVAAKVEALLLLHFISTVNSGSLTRLILIRNLFLPHHSPTAYTVFIYLWRSHLLNQPIHSLDTTFYLSFRCSSHVFTVPKLTCFICFFSLLKFSTSI